MNKEGLQLTLDILYTAEWLQYKVMSVLKKYELTYVQFHVLRKLMAADPNPLPAGSFKHDFINSDITRLISRLEEKGFVNRKLCPANRRKVDITINKRGKELLLEIMPNIETSLHHFFQDIIDKKEAIDGVKLLNKIRNAS